MTYQFSTQVSDHLFLREAPERKYPPSTTCYCTPIIPSRCPSYIDYCNYCCCYDCCCCCCCCCYHDICCRPLHYDYSSSSSNDLIKNKYKYKKENKKEEENINTKISKKEKEEPKKEIKEEPKENQVEQIQVEENQGEENQGEENQGEENQGEENQGEENQGEENQGENKKRIEYENYEQNQFNEFMKKLMAVESQVEDAKISLAMNPDFNCEDAFKLFESNNKDYLDINDIKAGLNLIGLNPTEKHLNLLMKRFDLQKNGFINYADFFDVVVPFEKNYRTRVENRIPNSCCPCRSPEVFSKNTVDQLRELFNLIINCENEINNMRKLFGTLRLNLRDIFGLLDKNRCGFFSNEDLLEYLDSNGLLSNIRDADLLFIRLDKNRNGKIDFFEVEDEIQTIY